VRTPFIVLFFGALTLLCFLAGCSGMASFTRFVWNDPIKRQDVTFIVQGKTTFMEVIGELGVPDRINGLGDHGAVAVYYFLDAKYSNVNYGWPLQFFLQRSPDLILAGGGLGTDMLEVFFDSKWKARGHAFAKHVGASQYRGWPFDLEPPDDRQLQQIAF
jgi:hypothetical protein